jgi:hypothetical protein
MLFINLTKTKIQIFRHHITCHPPFSVATFLTPPASARYHFVPIQWTLNLLVNLWASCLSGHDIQRAISNCCVIWCPSECLHAKITNNVCVQWILTPPSFCCPPIRHCICWSQPFNLRWLYKSHQVITWKSIRVLDPTGTTTKYGSLLQLLHKVACPLAMSLVLSCHLAFPSAITITSVDLVMLEVDILDSFVSQFVTIGSDVSRLERYCTDVLLACLTKVRC